MADFQNELVEHLPQLRAFARSLTAGNAALADDLVQDTCVNALRAQDQFAPGTNLRAWLFTILRNRFRSIVKRQQVRAEDGDDDLDRHASAAMPQTGSLEMMAFRGAFAELRAEHREALVLAVIHGLAYDEIAEICNCRVGTVKSRVSRARSQLRQRLLEEPEQAAPEQAAADERRDDATADELRAAL